MNKEKEERPRIITTTTRIITITTRTTRTITTRTTKTKMTKENTNDEKKTITRTTREQQGQI